MRRAIFAVTGLAASTTLLVVLKGGGGATQVAQSVPTVPPGAPVAPTPVGVEPAPSAAPSAAASAGTSTAPAPTRSTSRSPGTRSTSRAPAPPKRTIPPPKPPTGPYKVTGPVVENEYGLVQVQITMTGDRITNVDALELPQETADSDRRSAQVDGRYSGRSGQAVQRQSADLDTVSGATATSGSYRQSLQAAIDAAKRGQRD
jgi:uncharacterized protein with FMN-binding domain